jgi:hypothetical protein
MYSIIILIKNNAYKLFGMYRINLIWNLLPSGISYLWRRKSYNKFVTIQRCGFFFQRDKSLKIKIKNSFWLLFTLFISETITQLPQIYWQNTKPKETNSKIKIFILKYDNFFLLISSWNSFLYFSNRFYLLMTFK